MIGENIPKPERLGANPFFVILYLLVFVGMVLYMGFLYGWSFESYSWENITNLKGHLIPAFMFGLAGIMTVRSKKSFVYAICAAAVTLLILVFLSQMGWMKF